MDDAAFGRVVQAGGHLDHVADALGGRERAAPVDQLPQVVALDELEGDEVQPLVFAAEEDAGDVLVVELRRGAGFLLEAVDALGIACHLRRQDLQRDDAVEFEVARFQHGGHAARADGFDQLEVAEPAARDRRQIARDGERSRGDAVRDCA